MRRSFMIMVSGMALSGWMAGAALADRGDKADERQIDAQKELNAGKRRATEDQMKAAGEQSGREVTSLEKELRDKLGDSWNIRKSGNGYLATRVAPKKADEKMSQKLDSHMRDFRDHYKDAQVTRTHDEVMLRGRVDDCADAAKAANDFAGIDGVNRIFVDFSCAASK